MADRDTTRLLAWSTELRTVHHRLRQALAASREAEPLDLKISQLAKRRGVSKSQILRAAAAAYVEAS